jgi:conjugal transfer pilin signal peptidase TrbI
MRILPASWEWPDGSLRANVAASMGRWRKHLQQHAAVYLIVILLALVAVLLFKRHYMLGFNTTYSMPPAWYVVERGVLPQKGEHVAFVWHGGGPYSKGSVFVKRVEGVAGDIVSVQGRDVFINGVKRARAKEVSRTGQPLEIAAPGTIPEGYYYVHLDSSDSLDSRYRLTGLIPASAFVGRAHVHWLP